LPITGPTTAIAVFLTNPEAGTVKARLAGALGPEGAARFYWECALLVMAKALRLRPAEVFVFFSPAEKRAEVETLVLSRFGRFEGRFVAQSGTGMGDRVLGALDHLRELGFARQIVLRTDSPTLPLEFIQKGVAALEDRDCVIGPTWAGDFYLFGLKRADAGIFRNVPWGSGLELGQIHDNLSSAGMTFQMLPRWQEMDSPDDLPFLKGQVRHADYRRLKAILEETDRQGKEENAGPSRP
jgi:hypothetical protein